VNAFEVCGAILAIWAVVVAGLGISREGFPGKAERLVGLISLVLVVLAIGSAIYTGTHEKKAEGSKGEPGSALLHLSV
jgi:hypothetical protein